MLLLANLLVLVGLDKNQNYILCCSVAGMLQYTLLASFNWMLVQVCLAIFIYICRTEKTLMGILL